MKTNFIFSDFCQHGARLRCWSIMMEYENIFMAEKAGIIFLRVIVKTVVVKDSNCISHKHQIIIKLEDDIKEKIGLSLTHQHLCHNIYFLCTLEE